MKYDKSHEPILRIRLHYGEIQIRKYTIKGSLSPKDLQPLKGFPTAFGSIPYFPLKYVLKAC